MIDSIANEYCLRGGTIHGADFHELGGYEAFIVFKSGFTFSDGELLPVKEIGAAKINRFSALGQYFQAIHGEFKIAFEQSRDKAFKPVLGETDGGAYFFFEFANNIDFEANPLEVLV